LFGDALNSKATSIKCPGKLKTYKNGPTQTPILDKVHTHPPDTDDVEVNKCLARMKYKAATASTNPVEIYCDELGNLDRQTQAQMPSKAITKRTLRNQRSKNNHKKPTSLNECTIEGELKDLYLINIIILL